MNKSFIVLMTISGLTSLQASNESNLTKAFRGILLVDGNFSCNLENESPRHRVDSAFHAIKEGKVADAGELAADLVLEGKMSPEKVVRSTMQSPILDQIAFAQAYNLRMRMNSPFYTSIQKALNNDAYSQDETKDLQVMLDDYLAGTKMTSLRIPSPKNNK